MLCKWSSACARAQHNLYRQRRSNEIESDRSERGAWSRLTHLGMRPSCVIIIDTNTQMRRIGQKKFSDSYLIEFFNLHTWIVANIFQLQFFRVCFDFIVCNASGRKLRIQYLLWTLCHWSYLQALEVTKLLVDVTYPKVDCLRAACLAL